LHSAVIAGIRCPFRCPSTNLNSLLKIVIVMAP
jgi:hypothetical protein